MDSKIHWLEWSKETFERAKMENKPILLSISATWCHWCHVMDQNTYDNKDVAEFINESFIPVRVDTDKRPDINERYNQGGWPSTVFMDENGSIITGATYVPPYEFLSMLGQISELYKHRKKDIINKIIPKPLETVKKGELSDDIFSSVLKILIESFDVSYGGFGFEPKFPMPEAVEICFVNFLRTKKNDANEPTPEASKHTSISSGRQYLRMATITLDSMAMLQDKVEGGFFRYSVTRDWEVPHFEKMLEGNAGIIRNYLHAYSITQKEMYKKIAEHALNYIKNNLANENHFYASQDADEEYYKKKMEERQISKNPYIDKTMYTNFNSMMVQTYLKAFLVLKDKFYLGFAEKAIAFIIENCLSKEGLSHTPGEKLYFLTDHARFSLALIEAYEITQNKKYLQTAEELALVMMDKFYDKESRNFNDISEEGEGLLAQRMKNIVENSIAAEVFLRLSIHLESSHFKEIAQSTLESFALSYKDYSIHAAQYALAVEKLLHAREIHIYGDYQINDLLINPRNIVVQLTEDEAKKKGYQKKGVYVCSDGLCKYYESVEDIEKP
ncbi:MAG TPA: DUF255 domain-containing protein [archaeon]|nr:DUF255 domain-containing protein [archaeon]